MLNELQSVYDKPVCIGRTNNKPKANKAAVYIALAFRGPGRAIPRGL